MSTAVETQVPLRLIPQVTVLTDALAPLAEPALRAVTGVLLIPHGAQKLFGAFGGYGLDGTGQWLESIGFAPGYLFAVLIGLLEFVGGIMLAAGVLTRLVAAAVTAFMAVAVIVHLPAGYFWNEGGFEMPVLWGMAALYFVLKGGGRYSVDRLIGREV